MSDVMILKYETKDLTEKFSMRERTQVYGVLFAEYIELDDDEVCKVMGISEKWHKDILAKSGLFVPEFRKYIEEEMKIRDLHLTRLFGLRRKVIGSIEFDFLCYKFPELEDELEKVIG